MTGAAAGKGRTEEPTGPEERRGDGMARAGTGMGWRELGKNVPPATGTGTDAPTGKRTGTGSTPEITAKWTQVPNEPKLSDGGKKRRELGTDATPPFAGAPC